MLHLPLEESITYHTIDGVLRATLDHVPDAVRIRIARTLTRALVSPTTDGRFLFNNSSIALVQKPDGSATLAIGPDGEFESLRDGGFLARYIPIGRPFVGIPQREIATLSPTCENRLLIDLFRVQGPFDHARTLPR